MDTKTNGSSEEKPVRKLSLSYLRKTLVIKKKGKKSNDNQITQVQCDCESSEICNCEAFNKNSDPNVLCQCTVNQKNHKGFFRTIRKGFTLKDTFNMCRSKQKVKAKESSSTDISLTDDINRNGFASTRHSRNSASTCPLQFVHASDTDSSTESEPFLPIATGRPLALILTPSSTPMDSPPDSLEGSRSLSGELFGLARHGWYWGPISRQEAEEKLFDEPDGTFLVRDSSADHYLLSVSFRSSGKTLHSRIEHNCGMFSFYAQEGFASIVELINHSVSFSQSAVFCYSRPRSPTQPAFPVRLTKPLSRFMQVRSLQYLCRFVIRQYTRVDNIQKLPLPNSLKGYIQEGYF